MDNNYLYLIGFLGIILVSFIVYYFLKKGSKNNKSNNELTNSKNNTESDQIIECDGDKCFIKPKLKKYEKCDEQNPI